MSNHQFSDLPAKIWDELPDLFDILQFYHVKAQLAMIYINFYEKVKQL